jgi:hypothetical protein
MRRVIVETIRFRRTITAKPEMGIIINYGDGPIIDMNGEVVPPPVYHWQPIAQHRITVTEE